MTAVNPALPALKPVPPAGFGTVAAESAGTQVNTFLSFLKQSSATQTAAADSTSEATPADRALKNNKGWGALPVETASASVAPAENQPIPLKLSFNVFGNFRAPQQSTRITEEGENSQRH